MGRIEMRKSAVKTLGVPAATATAFPAEAQYFPDHMGMWSGNWGWGHMIVGGFVMLLFWAAVIAVIILIVRALAGPHREPRGQSRSALDILEERFARGEIEREEFEEKRSLLVGRENRRE